MSPCSPNDINISEPDGPSLPAIPGFGVPFSPALPSFALPEGFPEDLNELWNTLSMILPPGTLKPSLNPNFGKDVFDAIMSLLDKFFPFLMLYKFFLPILNLIICIIEVICALMNPFKLIRAVKRLFRNCIPEFLSLFPIFALIVMILSLLFLLLALIEYIILQILRLIAMILRNIRAVVKAVKKADAGSILAITKKLGILLCSFQNIFVILAIFAVIIQIIKDILKLLFRIPPCDDDGSSDADGCCTPEVCPAFIRNNEQFTRFTGTLQYFPYVFSGVGALPAPLDTFSVSKRNQTHQLFDDQAPQEFQTINISDSPDITTNPKTVFFPSDSTFTDQTPPEQAPYKVDVRVFYDPVYWTFQSGVARWIRFVDCIVLRAPSVNYSDYNNSTINVPSGVMVIAGGRGYEDDATTVLIGAGGTQANLENFLYFDATSGLNPDLLPTDGFRFTNVEYTFKINHMVLLGKALITLGCIPTVAIDRTVINSVFGGNAGVNFTLLNNLLNTATPPAPSVTIPSSVSPTDAAAAALPSTFPDVNAAQAELQAAVDALRLDMSEAGAAAFQATCLASLNKLKGDTNFSIGELIGIGYDPYKSSFTLTPEVQFTSKKILVQVQLNETNNISITDNLPESVANNMETRFRADLGFGFIGPFKYDGSRLFETTITSDLAGSGTIKISFDNKFISTITIPSDITIPPTITPTELPYSFIFTPTTQVGDTTVQTGRGDTDGEPRRDAGDLSRSSSDNRGS